VRFVAPVPPTDSHHRAAAPSFSVVIAAYEAADTISEALASAVAQTLPATEILVVDDGSTDNTAEIVADFGQGVKLLRQANGGEAAAKNAGTRAASGEFVVFLDADDTFAERRLERLAELAVARPDLDVLTTDAWIEVGTTRVRRCYDETWSFPTENQRTEIVRRNFVFGLAAVSRKRLLASGGFDETLRFATDWDLWCRLIFDGARVGLVDEPLASYRLRPAGLSAQRPLLLRGRCLVLERALTRDDLSASERSIAEASLRRERRNALVAEARWALAARSPDARRSARALATAAGIPIPQRLRAALAWLAPSVAGRLLTRSHGEQPGPAGVSLPEVLRTQADDRAHA
jgi:hypothetical protein